MKLLAGTSGYAFKEWKGSFYPADLKDDGWLGYYAGRFPSVEINNTFYRLPKESVLQDWASQVPETFTFAIKASQRITHMARLKEDAASPLEYLLRTTSSLGGRLGPILFQRGELERVRPPFGAEDEEGERAVVGPCVVAHRLDRLEHDARVAPGEVEAPEPLG